MSKPEPIQELLRRWTPISLMGIPEEVKSPEVFTDYLGTDSDPIPIGHTSGLLTVIGYSHDVGRPYVAQCACGNVCTFTHLSLKVERPHHCGCLYQITRTAYLIRLRLEAMRSWWQHVPSWLDDLDKLREYGKKYHSSFNGKSYPAKLTRIESKENPLEFDRKVEGGHPDKEDAFLAFIAPTEEYSKFLREIATKLIEEYRPWPAIPMANVSAYASYKQELPEFDSATFINFVNYLADPANKTRKRTSKNG